ncbi:hypothetical protein B0J11DRAFT_573740 [Dendryphion nanum]|uniref:Uncharacterized protein n=1 Tax=Dendryphion nanum TaxID=256645 RepID=A0A9P9CYY7_9PLEO|nr:hypothetical protein B0J11DRAFT_573740 [Dendryphion nanum]
MDKAPHELIRNIVRLIKPTKGLERLFPYATISKLFQEAVEEITFQSLALTTQDLAVFRSIFQGKNIVRRNFLKLLSLQFELPKLRHGACLLKFTPNRETDSATISEGIQVIFQILSVADSQLERVAPLKLHFMKAYRQNECTHHHWTSQVDVKSTRAQYGFYKVLIGTELPSIGNIHEFSFQGNRFKGLDYVALANTASKLPDLRSLYLSLHDFYEWGTDNRIKQRTGFSDGITKIRGQSLEEINIIVSHDIQKNDCVQAHDLVLDADPFRKSFWHISQFKQLSRLRITGPMVITSDLFTLPTYLEEGIVFPALKHFVLHISPETADGKWFFLKNEEKERDALNDPRWKEYFHELELEDSESSSSDYIDTEELDGSMLVFGESATRLRRVNPCRCKSELNPETATPFLGNAAKLLGSLPGIQTYIIRITGDHNERKKWKPMKQPWIRGRDFEVQYLRRGNSWDSDGMHYDQPSALKEDLTVDRLYWRFAESMPQDDVQQYWYQAVGRDCQIWRLRQKWRSLYCFDEEISQC